MRRNSGITRRYLMPLMTRTVVAVQNTWYDVITGTPTSPYIYNGRIYYTMMSMATLAEDLEVEWIVDGITLDGAQAAAAAGTVYNVYHGSYTDVLTSIANAVLAMGAQAFMDCNSFRMKIRKTSANGANNLQGWIIYGESR